MTLIKRLITGCFFIFTFPFVTYSTNSTSGHFADSLYLAGNYTLAAIEYERIYFLEQNPQLKNSALLQKASSLKQLKQYTAAIANLQRIPLFFLNDSTRNIVHFEKALCYYLNGDFTLAEFEVRQLKEQQNPFYSAKHDILLALSLNEQNKWANAKLVLGDVIAKSTFSQNQKDSLVATLNMLYSKRNLPKLKSENKLFWISFIPGAGIAYAGKPLEGAFNFTLNATALGLGVLGILNGYYITGYAGGAIMLEKFYFGGRRRSEYLLKQTNYTRSRRFNQEVKAIAIKL
ncbi:MAG: hypothetical protein JW783_16175 [Bacteroidales bacterium]|nr:hypothetical protein [Bacteroidales bacterium]MBN2750676.1 hypothetical protein [Bacteroidales bacterium]